MSVKALAEMVLQGNQQGNREETSSFLAHESRKPKTPPRDPPSIGCALATNQRDHKDGYNSIRSGKTDLFRMVGEALAAVDREGRPWPTRFFANLPAEDRQRLRDLEKQIDCAVLANDGDALPSLLAEWQHLVLSRLN